MKRRVLSMLLVICIGFSLLPTAWAANEIASGSCGDNLHWTLDSDGVLTISGEGDMYDYKSNADSRSPWYSYRSQIKEIIISSGTGYIGQYAFFALNAVTAVELPDTLITIGADAFQNCTGLKSVEIPVSVEKIQAWAFYGCSQLEKVSLLSTKVNLVDKTFYGCPNLKTAGSIGSNCNIEFAWTDEIPSHAFDGCSGLESIIIPNRVTIIGANAFDGCLNLKSIDMPNGIVEIGEQAFIGCSNLSEVIIPKSVTTMGAGIFQNCDSLITAGPVGEDYNIQFGWTEEIPREAFWNCGSLSEVKLPDSITTIKFGAFRGTGLTSVYIPASVTSIDGGAFAECTLLKDAYFYGKAPSASGAFESSVILYYIFGQPGWIDSAAYDADAGTWNGYRLEIWDGDIPESSDPPVSGNGSIVNLFPTNGATNVGYDASDPPTFQITFDREVASIDGQEFVADVDLTSAGAFAIYRAVDDALIYKPNEYSGTNFRLDTTKKILTVAPTNNHVLLEPNTQYYITIGEGFVRFVGGSSSPAIGKGEWAFRTKIFEKDGTFTFPGSNGKNIEYSYSYSDKFFYDTGNKYNHNLANMSLNLAISAFNSFEASASNYNELVAAKNVRKLLSDLNFESIETNIDNGNNSYSGMPYTNSIAAAYARKNISTDYGNFTLIAIAIRGGGYEAEWGGNFTVGQNGNHQGFQLASDKVLAGLKKYINSQNISGDIKIWITGYSRAAATANLTAAAIDDGKLFTGTNGVDNSVVRLSTANVYAYTFETPMGTTNSTSSSLYANIFNIVNPVDLVPKVAPGVWNFGRYGITYYMPSGDTNAVGYSDIIMRVTKEYSKIVNGTDSGSLLAIKQFTNQSAILDKFLDILSTMMPRTTYSPKYEHLLVPIASELMGADGNQYSDNIFWAIEEFCIRYPDDAVDIIDALKDAIGNRIVWYIVAEQGFEQLYKALGWNGSTAFDTISMIGDIIQQSHYPEVTMAWMRTINGADGYGSGKYRKLYVNCPVDVSVYDSDNRLVAQIVNDDPQLIDDSLIGSYIDGDGQKIVVLPTDMEYHVVINATDNGTMSYTVDEYNIDKATTERIVGYSEISIAKGEILTGLVENLNDGQKANYPLYRENETTPLKPDVDEGGEDNNQSGNSTRPSTSTTPNYGEDSSDSDPTYSVTVPDRVTGGTVKVSPTSASEGQRVTITVKANSGYELNTLTVTDSKGNLLTLTDQGDGKYTFIMPNSKVSIDVSFKAVISDMPINFTDVQPNAYYADAVAWAVENGITFGITDTTFGPDVCCTRAQIVSFLWRQVGSPKMSNANPFTDVSASDYYYDAVLWAVENGITFGSTDTTFSPNMICTRAQAMTFLYRDKKSPMASGTNNFTDVSADDYYADAIQWAVANGVTYGTNSTTFSPDQDCTRAQIISFLYRARAN